MMLRPRIPLPAGLLRTRSTSLIASSKPAIGVFPSCDRPSLQTANRVISRFSLDTTRRYFQIITPTTQQGFPAAVSVTVQDESVSVIFADSRSRRVHLSLLWLRDACNCPKCVDPHSGQKNFATVELPDVPKVQTAEIADDGSLRITWASDIMGDGDSGATHVSIYPPSQLLSNRYGRPRPTFWNRRKFESLLSSPTSANRISHKDWTTDRDAFLRALAALDQTGLIFVTDVPHVEDEVERIANQIGSIQDTFYGRTWDVKSKPRAENVAYTSQFLGLHQDLLYHRPTPRLQLLHCLENSCEGGESLFSDGMRAASELKRTKPGLFQILKRPIVNFWYHKNGHSYHRARSTVVEKSHIITAVNWAPPFQAPFQRDKILSMSMWKTAAAAFEASISAPENMVEVKLNPGDCIIFDNRRVLHGRREFATAAGSRWLKGAYVSNKVYQALVRKHLTTHARKGAD